MHLLLLHLLQLTSADAAIDWTFGMRDVLFEML